MTFARLTPKIRKGMESRDERRSVVSYPPASRRGGPPREKSRYFRLASFSLGAYERPRAALKCLGGRDLTHPELPSPRLSLWLVRTRRAAQARGNAISPFSFSSVRDGEGGREGGRKLLIKREFVRIKSTAEIPR